VSERISTSVAPLVTSASLQGCDYPTAIIHAMSSSFQLVQHYPILLSLTIFYETSKLEINVIFV
jgi:hypothetical protein